MQGILGLPPLASEHGAAIDRVIGMIHWLMLVLFIGWGIYFIYTLIRFRAGRNPKADYHGMKSHFSKYIEAGVALIEALILIFFAMPIWSSVKNDMPDEADAVEIRVVAEQFAWNIHYPGPDGVFGVTSPDLIDPVSNTIGLDPDDPFAADDIVSVNQLHIPVNRPIIINLTSKDVIHSFSLPVMRVKQDVIPGMEIPVWFTAIKTGDWEIACAQLCGLGHYRMRGFLTVETDDEFEAWKTAQGPYLPDLSNPFLFF